MIKWVKLTLWSARSCSLSAAWSVLWAAASKPGTPAIHNILFQGVALGNLPENPSDASERPFWKLGNENWRKCVCVVPEFERIIRVVMLSPVLVGERGLEGGRVRGSSCVLGRWGWGEACCRGEGGEGVWLLLLDLLVDWDCKHLPESDLTLQSV